MGRSTVEGMNVEPSDADLIAFTRLRFRQAGAKDKALRETFGLTSAQFWQRVLRLLADPDRVAALPAGLQAQCARLKRRIAA